jgi:hypothetical protein
MPDMDAYDVIRFFSELFNVPTKYLQFPDTIFYFIIPFITIVFLFYTLLNRKLRIFRNPGINLIIATIISFFSAFVVTIFPPAWTVSIVLGCAILVMGRFSYKRLIITGLIFGMVQWLYPWVMGIFL